MHDYVPDFVVRMGDSAKTCLIIETKGFDPLKDIKRAAADRWVAAVNADGRFGCWDYQMTPSPADVRVVLDRWPMRVPLSA